jgi:hypothetical protein
MDVTELHRHVTGRQQSKAGSPVALLLQGATAPDAVDAPVAQLAMMEVEGTAASAASTAFVLPAAALDAAVPFFAPCWLLRLPLLRALLLLMLLLPLRCLLRCL